MTIIHFGKLLISIGDSFAFSFHCFLILMIEKKRLIFQSSYFNKTNTNKKKNMTYNIINIKNYYLNFLSKCIRI